MCGIAGFITNKKTPESEILLKSMVDIIKHRGPDDDGLFHDDNVALGMRRLSIIDIGGGMQPISNEDGSKIIFFNGEIYNYQTLRLELKQLGHIFKTDGDTEVILHGYEEYGPEIASKLRGMFAFSIYDKVTETLFIARDYFGIKPLYYRVQTDTDTNTINDSISSRKFVSFGSEIKSLLCDKTYTRKVNTNAVYNYLSFQYNPLEETMFKDIFSLPPANHITIDLKTGNFTKKEYWDYKFNSEKIPTESTESDLEKIEEDFKKVILEKMRDSVKAHMISDVPVGAFLSGGIDSAVIVTLMDEIGKTNGYKDGKVKTFTIGFNEVSEHSEASVIAKKLGTDHHEITVAFDEYFNELPKIAWHFDEPVADPSAVALYFLAKEARKHVTVVLSGEGSDELFGGYNIYREPFDLAPIASLPTWIKSSFIKPLINLPFDFYGKNYLKRTLKTLQERYIGNAYIFKADEVGEIWKNNPTDTIKRLSLSPLYEKVSGQTDSAKMQYIDLHTWLPGDILAKADKMTMANSLEARVPFLDIEIAKLSETIPEFLKYKNGNTKYILRQAMKDILPSETSERKKLGFPTPIKHWLKNTPDADKIKKIILENSFIRETFNLPIIEKLFQDHQSGKKDTSRKIYVILMLALWHNAYFQI